MTNALVVAKYILFKGREKGIKDISPLKLQKLIFLAYENNVKSFKKPLFDGDFEVWRHGPVLKEIYNQYKKYGSEIIDETIENNFKLNNESKRIIDKTLDDYGFLSAWSLVEETHKPTGVWYFKMENGENIIGYNDVVKFC